jgi:paraquat-inducible protein A
MSLLLACHDCATIPRPPASFSRGRLDCCRCGRVLEDTKGRSLDSGLACAITTLLLLIPANLLSGMTVHFAGLVTTTRLGSGLFTAWHQGWPLLTIVLALQAVVLPLVRFALLSVALSAVRFGVRQRWVGTAFRYCQTLDSWAMADVLLVGAGVGFGRIDSQIPVRIDAGGWCFVGAAVMTMLTRATLEPREVWRRLGPDDASPPTDLVCAHCDLILPACPEGARCPRCTARLYRRRPNSVTQTTALLLATAALTPVAYGLPMSELWKAGTPDPHTIGNGILLLFQSGFWYFGILIFLLSVAFPLTKIVALSWFIVSIRRGSAAHLRGKTRLYRFIDEAGRWSMIDPFTVFIFAPMLQIGQLAHINIRAGSLAFLSTVVLSMIAARTFDPRLMWDMEAGASSSSPVKRESSQVNRPGFAGGSYP